MGNFIVFIVLAIGVLIYNMQLSSMGGKEGALAYDLIRQELKDPSSASWDSIKVLSKENGRSLVVADITAKNSFNANVKSRFCVCVALADKVGKVLSTDGGCQPIEMFKNECASLTIHKQ
ncbi:hypothetical protein [Bdellovibrio sp. GT3]|uniref:hypothetical protein n=1 Tax=Bdellovibrio sp. GT3 TaxID=3136282 RepID=UPI0030F33708